MILNCDHCSARLTLDDSKLPARPFGVRCDKCGGAIDVPASAIDNGVRDSGVGGRIAHGEDHAADDRRVVAATDAGASTPDEMLRSLAQALRGLALAGSGDADVRSTPLPGAARRNARRALICLPQEMRAAVARVFTAKGYDVFAAHDSDDAVKRLREDRAEVLVFATEFDAQNQGALFVTRELSALRMPERRRIFVVQMSRTARTSDAHAAFLASVNLVVNEADLERLDAAFDRAEQAHQELYLVGRNQRWGGEIEER